MNRLFFSLLPLLFGISTGLAENQPILPKDTLPASIEPKKLPSGIKLKRHEPKDNLLSHEKVRLGRRLFFDPILSKDGTVSCASCHQPNHGFASPDKLAIGIGGAIGNRNAPSILNRAFGKKFFWDGRASSLEEQALQPIENTKELGTSLPAVLKNLRADQTYVQAFTIAFNDQPKAGKKPTNADESFVTANNLAKALAAFQRTLLIGDSAVDRFQAGEYGALNSQQRRGLWIFESRGGCWKCHSGDNYSDEDFHNTGIGFGRSNRDLGRFEQTKKEGDQGKFKTPSLRGVAETFPYMHDGSLKTLRDVVEFYNLGGNPRDPNIDDRIKPLGLTAEEIDALVEFLKALSDTSP